jgi:transcriptional regulator with XRE-family HTH domain
MRKSLSQYEKEFLARTKLARERIPYTQEQIARILGISQGRYKQYETRTLLPHEFITPFCLACQISETWLFSGRGRAPASLPRAGSRAA